MVTTQQVQGKQAEIVREHLNGGLREVTELSEGSALVMFFVQKLGKAAADQIREKIEAIGGAINEHFLGQVLDALQARGFISYSKGKRPDGAVGQMWKVKRAAYAAPPEVAHIDELLPRLIATDDAQRLLDGLNEAEAEGDGTSKAKSKLGYTDYVQVQVTFRTLDELLGSQPSSPWLEQLIKKSPYNGVADGEDDTLRFWRDARNGNLLIGSDAVAGWIRTGLRDQGFGEAVVQYIGFDAVQIQPTKPLVQVALPVIAHGGPGGGGGKGRGITTYEAVQPGQTFSITFRVPTRGFMPPERFVAWLCDYAPRPVRGISPARGKRFGKLEVIGWRDLGKVTDFVASAKAVEDLLSDDAKALRASLQI